MRRVSLKYQPFRQTYGIHRAFATHRERVAVTGARGGKTTCGVHDVIDKAVDQPGIDFDDVDRGEPYTIVVGARDYPQVSRVILPAFIRAVPPNLVVAPYHSNNHLFKLRGRYTESWIYFLSARFWESWQGMKLYGVWLDEFTLLKEQMYDEARTRLSDRRGWLLLTGTPHGPNWAYDRIVKPLRDGTRSDIFFTTWWTEHNPMLPPTFREDLKEYERTMPRKYFNRTFRASWDTFEGQIYDEWNEGVHVLPSEDYCFIYGSRTVGPPPRRSSSLRIVRLERVVAGVDWGIGTGHAGAIVVAGKSTDGVWYVLDESVAENVRCVGRTMEHDSWIKRALALRALWKIRTFYPDPSRPDNIRYFLDAKLEVETALNDVKSGIQCVAKYMHVDEDALERGAAPARLYVMDRCQTIRDEVRYYHWREGTHKEEPEKVFDNAMDGMRYGIYTSEERDGPGRGRKLVVGMP